MTSIIILAYNQLKYTKQCIESIFEYVSPVKTPFEVIVVNNGSTDGTREYLDGLRTSGIIQVIHNEENRGFPAANNQAAKIAKGEYLLLLNNDTIVTEGFLEKLLRCIRSDNQLAMVGPYTNYSSGRQMVMPSPEYKGNEEMHKYAQRFNGEEKYVNFLVFFCCLIKKSVWDEIGGLDEDFGRGCFEDNLFCWRAVEKGYKLKVCNAFIHHYISRTFGYQEDIKKRKEYSSLMARNQKIFLRKINRYKTISLCMICADTEKPETLKRCLESIAEWVDEICIVFNYKWFPKFYTLKNKQQKEFRIPNKFKSILPMIERFYPNNKCSYLKFTDFSDMRNRSLDMATGDYILWLDVDDVCLTPEGIRDVILYNPDIDAFRFNLLSKTEIGTQETIFHTNLFKNRKDLRFKGRVHEDINISINELNLKRTTTNLTISHLGYLNLKAWKRKNLRNYKLLLLDLKDNPSSLVYYHIVNCLLIIGGYKNMVRAIQYVDECLERFKLKQDDPLLPKMWVLRGVACMDAKQHLAAKQSFHKAYDEWKNIEAAVNLAELYIREKDYDKAIEILIPIYELKEFPLTNIPMDTVQAECMMLQKLGDCYSHKAYNTKELAKIKEYSQKAETHYREYLSIRLNLMVIDRLCKILRDTGRVDEAAFLTIKAVNKFPGYFIGWGNLGSYEMQSQRYFTARVFLKEALRLKPGFREARHNLKMLEKGKYGKEHQPG